MAWNTARVTLLPPRWKQVVTPSPRGRTAAGGPVHITRPVRTEGDAGPALRLADVCDWLAKHGFHIAERSASSVCLRWQDVEVFLAVEGEEVAEIVLTFTLDRHAFPRRESWEQFLRDLCAAWPLALADAGRPGERLASSEFGRLLEETPAWREFRETFGWPPRSPLASQGPGSVPGPVEDVKG